MSEDTRLINQRLSRLNFFFFLISSTNVFLSIGACSYDPFYCENKCLYHVYNCRDLKFGIFWNHAISMQIIKNVCSEKKIWMKSWQKVKSSFQYFMYTIYTLGFQSKRNPQKWQICSPIEQVSCERDVNIGSDKCGTNLITTKSHFIVQSLNMLEIR